MKKILVIACLCILTDAGSQNYAISTFLDTFKVSNNNSRSSIARTGNGTLFQIPYESPNPNPQRLKVIVTDSVFNIQKVAAFDLPNVNATAPMRFFGLGAYRTLTVHDYNVQASIFTTIDTSAQVVSSFVTSELSSACPTRDGGYIAFGYDSNKVIRFDSLNNILWQYRYIPPAGYSFHLNDVIEIASSGEITLTGRLNDLVATDSVFTAVVHLDANGIFIWAKRYYTVYGIAPLSLLELHQDYYSGDLYLFNISAGATVILSLDANGNYKWYKYYARTGCTVGSTPNYYFDGYGGNIYVQTIYACNMSGAVTVMCIEKSNGSLLWTKLSGHGLTSFSNDQYGPDIRYGTGSYNTGKVNDAISVQCNDNIASANDNSQALIAPYSMSIIFTSQAATTVLTPFVYVNQGPFTNTIVQSPICDNLTAIETENESDVSVSVLSGQLHIDQSASGNMEFTNCAVYDLQGRIVATATLQNSVTDVPVNFSVGVYIVQLTSESGNVKTARVFCGY